MWRVALIGLALTLGACGDDDKPGDTAEVAVETDVSVEVDNDVAPDTTPDAEATDTTPDGEVNPPPLASCVERPDALLAPPGTALPCELLPPGLVLTR